MFFIAKITLLELALSLSAPVADKTQYFIHLSFNSSLHLISGILKDLQKVLKYFNGTENAAILKIHFAASALVFPNNLVLKLKDIKYHN